MAWKPRKWAQGGAVHAERFADSKEIDKDWLYTFRDRVKRVEILRELIANLSEKRLEGSRSSLKEVPNRDVLPQGLDANLERLETLIERYKKELSEVLEMQERVEDWMSKLTPVQRDVIRLRFVVGLSLVKTADRLGKSEGYVKLLERDVFGR